MRLSTRGILIAFSLLNLHRSQNCIYFTLQSGLTDQHKNDVILINEVDHSKALRQVGNLAQLHGRS